MILLAAGDSFLWGSELSDSPHGGPNGHSCNTFAAHLATNASMQYQCAAYPGSANPDILQQVRTATKQHMVVVCWTWPSRSGHIHSDPAILAAQQHLRTHNIPYLFTCADNCVITPWVSDNLSEWFLFPPGAGANQTSTPRGFYQWARENKYPCGVCGHPLEQAHSIAAQLIQEKFNDMVKKHLEPHQT